MTNSPLSIDIGGPFPTTVLIEMSGKRKPGAISSTLKRQKKTPFAVARFSPDLL
jgi:hypothetical protein